MFFHIMNPLHRIKKHSTLFNLCGLDWPRIRDELNYRAAKVFAAARD